MLNKFAKNFTDLLRIKGITQKSIAEQLFVRPSAVNQWAKGKREPELDVLLRICAILETEPSEILGFNKAKIIIETQNNVIQEMKDFQTKTKEEKQEWLNSWLASLEEE